MTSGPPTQEKETLVPSSGFGEGSLLETSVAGADGYTRVEASVGSLTTNGHEFEKTLGDSEGQCCSPRGRQESDTNERLSNNKPG